MFSVAGEFDCLVPDFVVYRNAGCLGRRVRADVLLVGEILSPSKTRSDMEARKGPYSDAGIPCYWEVATARTGTAIEMVRAYALAAGHGPLPGGARPLRLANYLVVDEWTVADANGIRTSFPFPMEITWSELAH
ncbi:Uma2 family endonuclease [Nocardia jiangsuensis]|uniref:Uma2 family endonuclease n=1 Tax=Nocardia jiangsuensis TaxID=1691563 RepID=A0ABV8DNF3_9NOCA